MPIGVQISNLTVSYNRKPAIHHLNGAFAPGSATAVMGPNGAGKSTLLKVIAGVNKRYEGEIKFIGGELCIGYLPQIPEIDRSFPISVLEVVTMGLLKRHNIRAALKGEQFQKAKEAMAKVGLDGFEDRAIASLSAGQLHRVFLARLIAQDANLILLDEPFSFLDQRIIRMMETMVEEWKNSGKTIICVIHDEVQVRRFFPQTLLLARECVAWGDTATVLTKENMSKAMLIDEGQQATEEVCAI